MTELTNKEKLERKLLIAKRRHKYITARISLSATFDNKEILQEVKENALGRIERLEYELQHINVTEYLKKVREYADYVLQKQIELANFASENIKNMETALDEHLEFMGKYDPIRNNI